MLVSCADMSSASTNGNSTVRTLLILGRVSNVPTVWSNCLAGWILGGRGTVWGLILLCLGATCSYVGGMYLNDAFDAEFDRQHRRDRPIPSGAISETVVWIWGIGWLSAGALALAFFNWRTTILVLLMTASIVIYDSLHKSVAFSPLLMAMCRFFLYLVAASSAAEGVTGLSIWSSLVLSAYIVGLSYVARKESIGGFLDYWPCYLLGAPILLAILVNTGEYLLLSVVFSLILTIWVFQCLRYLFWTSHRLIGRAVSGLLAGIVLVDMLAVVGEAPVVVAVFLCFFAGALWLQRSVPAT